jgi:hypothetical protein
MVDLGCFKMLSAKKTKKRRCHPMSEGEEEGEKFTWNSQKNNNNDNHNKCQHVDVPGHHLTCIASHNNPPHNHHLDNNNEDVFERMPTTMMLWTTVN